MTCLTTTVTPKCTQSCRFLLININLICILIKLITVSSKFKIKIIFKITPSRIIACL